MQISFYVLGQRFVQPSQSADDDTFTLEDNDNGTALAINAEAVLDFVCKLTQTVLKKSDYTLLVIDDNISRLKQLDTHLWAFDPTSFIPHNLVLDEQPDMASLSAPVTLLSSLPKGFDGAVLNLAATPLPLTSKQSSNSQATSPQSPEKRSAAPQTPKYSNPTHTAVSTSLPDRVLEIITPDPKSKEQGRDKYRYYRELGFELKYFPIN